MLKNNYITKIITNKLYFLYLSIITEIYVLYSCHLFLLDDFYLHTTIGKWIIENKEIPTIGVGGWFAEENDLPWVAHEWASEVLSYLIYKFLDFNILHIEFFCMIFCFLFITCIIELNRKIIQEHYLQSYIFLCLLTISFYSFFVFRPQLASFTLFFSEILIIYKYYNREYKYAYFLPIIAFLWANFHGGSSCLAYYLPLGFLFFQIIPYKTLLNRATDKFTRIDLPKDKLLRLLLITCISIAFQFLNPYTYKMLLYPYTNMNDSFMLGLISEWFPLSIIDSSHWFIAWTLIFFILFILFTTKKQLDVIDAGFITIFLLMTLKSCRFMIYLDLTCAICLFKYIYGSQYLTPSSMIHNIFLTIISLILLTIYTLSYTTSNQLFKIEDDFKNHTELLNTIVSYHPHHVFNIALGNQMMTAGVKPFIDGRADVYTPYNYREAVSIDRLYINPEDVIKKYKIDYLVIENYSGIKWFLDRNSQKYKLIISDIDYSFYQVINE